MNFHYLCSLFYDYMDMKLSWSIVILCCSCLPFQRVSGNEVPSTIVDHIVADSSNTISQPGELTKRLIPQEENDSDKKTVGNSATGYRVQVFSDNNPRTAKSEARAKSRNISARFPQYRTYVTYRSPFWRLRIGDFRLQQDAIEAAQEIKRAFPSYRKEIRVVRDRINAGASH